jgi:hypothetical protein
MFSYSACGTGNNISSICAPHNGMLISNDLLRVTVKNQMQYGWVYAYLRSRQAQQIMTSAQYGHIIKHLEIDHLNALPVPIVNDKRAREFRSQAAAILDLRNRSSYIAIGCVSNPALALNSELNSKHVLAFDSLVS